jgi:ubiquitin-conjugating enzyme E2 D/E
MDSFYVLLSDPHPDSCLVPAALKLYRENRKLYDETARLWTQRYAM